MVSTRASTTQLILAQVTVDDKTNEIVSLLMSLQRLVITSWIVSFDVMGCQRSVAHQMLGQRGDYVLGMKGIQETVNRDVQFRFYHRRRGWLCGDSS